MAAIDWGDAPTWAGVLTGVVAAVGAGLAAVYARRAAASTSATLQVERDRDQNAARENARRHAEAVTAWCTTPPPPPYERTWTIHIRNGSPVPVYDVKASLRAELIGRGRERLPFHDIGDPDTETALACPVLPPEHTETHVLPWTLRGMYPGLDFAYDVMIVRLSFRDAAGRYWERGFDGQLVRLVP